MKTIASTTETRDTTTPKAYPRGVADLIAHHAELVAEIYETVTHVRAHLDAAIVAGETARGWQEGAGGDAEQLLEGFDDMRRELRQMATSVELLEGRLDDATPEDASTISEEEAAAAAAARRTARRKQRNAVNRARRAKFETKPKAPRLHAVRGGVS